MGIGERARMGIGDFDFGAEDGRRFRLYTDADPASDEDIVTVSRIHPDPDRRKIVASATGLGSIRPRFSFPQNWNETDRASAESEILGLWRAFQERKDASEQTRG